MVIFNRIIYYITGFKAVSVIGGRDISEDRRRLNKCSAIVATLGRLLHLIENCAISIKQIKLVVLDEADKLMTSDFRSSIDKLLKMFSMKPQIIASSATYADGLDKLLLTYMQNPVAVSATQKMPILVGIKQFVHVVTATADSNNEATTPTIKMMKCKVEAAENILKNISFKQCILFSNSQMRAESYYSYLTDKGWEVDLIIGAHEQHLRTSTFQKFCKFESRILIASDIIARGIDVANVNVVINLDVPADSSTYLHRIGRSARFGAHGIAISLVNDNIDMNRFEHMLGNIGADNIKVSHLPSVKNLDNTRLWNFANDQGDVSIFNEIDAGSKGEKSSEEYEKTPTMDIQQSNTLIQNLELLDISKLMLENKSQCDVQVDLDLFSDYSNHGGTDEMDVTSSEVMNMANGDKESNKGIQRDVQVDLDLFSDYSKHGGTDEISCFELDVTSNEAMNRTNGDKDLNKKNQHSDEMIENPESGAHHAFLQAVRNLRICQQPDVAWPILHDSKSEREHFTKENQKNKTDVAEIMKTNAAEVHNSTRRSKSMAQTHWQNIYWQQFNQINQSCCWMKSSFPPK